MTENQRVAIAVQRGRRRDQFELQAGTLRLGSASHCDVRLAPDEAAAEQLILTAHPRGLALRALVSEPVIRLDGEPLSDAVVESSATIEIGSVVLELQLLEKRASRDDGAALLKTVRRVAMLLGLSVTAYVVLHEPPAPSALRRSVPLPALFGVGPGNCRYRDRETALAFAQQQLSAAEGKRERSPFSTRDGVLAVPLYAAAAACFRSAGDLENASDAAQAGQRLATHLQEELHAHQARLEWFLERTRYEAAAQEVLVLRELVAGRNDVYAQWLAALARELRSTLQNPLQKKGA